MIGILLESSTAAPPDSVKPGLTCGSAATETGEHGAEILGSHNFPSHPFVAGAEITYGSQFFEGTAKMSSTARRSIRTTAVAAGIAALGIGIAGPALAAPSADVPELPAPDVAGAPAVDTAVPGTDFTQATDAGMPALPDAFAFDAPSFDSASVPTEMNAASLPAAPDTSGVVNTDGTGLDVAGSPDPASAAGFSQGVGALAQMDTMKSFADIAQKAAAGESVTANNDISN